MHIQDPYVVLNDSDPEETSEWIEALDALWDASESRAKFVVQRLVARLAQMGSGGPVGLITDYVNTIPRVAEPEFSGDEKLEGRILDILRWNAAVMVLWANVGGNGLGGHLSTYASTSVIYEVAFNHFLRGKRHPGGGDHVFFQGAAAPGIYSRAFLEGRLDRHRLEHYRREVDGKGLSSYIHPRLMPSFWEFPTASMGLGVINAIYQARFNRYLLQREIKDTSDQIVWGFFGDGEMDEPEATAALSLAAREQLDNLVFLINCNLQRLDGPVRGNGKVVQELEARFIGAGWRVIKVLWSSEWDRLFEHDKAETLIERLNLVVDGELQRLLVGGGGAWRDDFFGSSPTLKDLAEELSHEDLESLGRGGHDSRKIFAALSAAVDHRGSPVVVLAQTAKGWGLGKNIEGRNTTHQAKKMARDHLMQLRDDLDIPLSDREIEASSPPYWHPGADSEEVRYLVERRTALGGPVPERRTARVEIPLPASSPFEEVCEGSDRAISSTMSFVRLLKGLMKDKPFGKRVVPIVADEARTFGMESLIASFGIYSPNGQLYEPVDAEHLLRYREEPGGQMIQEGITEAGALGTFAAAGSSYATHGEPMFPFFIFYSIFGFQRVGDLIWSLGDQRVRGFLLGATYGRTTLNGEGLQHQDGHSLLISGTNPACISYDPAFGYEVAIIIREGLRRMIEEDEDLIYYLTLYNEPYPMPPLKPDFEPGIVKGMYLFRPATREHRLRAQLLGSGAILMEVLAAQEILEEDFGVAADVWSVTSYQQLRQDAIAVEEENARTSSSDQSTCYVEECLGTAEGPIIAASDSIKAVPDIIARWLPRDYVSLGTDGFGLSDTRAALRHKFGVDAKHIVLATLVRLERAGRLRRRVVQDAAQHFSIALND